MVKINIKTKTFLFSYRYSDPSEEDPVITFFLPLVHLQQSLPIMNQNEESNFLFYVRTHYQWGNCYKLPTFFYKHTTFRFNMKSIFRNSSISFYLFAFHISKNVLRISTMICHILQFPRYYNLSRIIFVLNTPSTAWATKLARYTSVDRILTARWRSTNSFHWGIGTCLKSIEDINSSFNFNFYIITLCYISSDNLFFW